MKRHVPGADLSDTVTGTPPVRDPATGAARLDAERRRITDILARATPPQDVGPVPVAPARPFGVTTMRGVTPKGCEDWEVSDTGYRGRATVVTADAFDRMAAAAAKARSEDPFTPAHKATGRAYGALVQRYLAAGYGRINIYGTTGSGGGSGGGFMDAVCADGQSLRRLRRAVGPGVAMAVRRIRPSARGPDQRGLITTMALVGHVCCDDMVIKAVLAHYGWSIGRQQIDALTAALSGALDRMRDVI